jgi:hypothetical protein
MNDVNCQAEKEPPESQPRLRWYQYRLSTILWITVIVALLVANVVMRGQLSKLEQRMEEIKEKGAMREAEPGCITQVGFGPGWIFRGDLPEGKWRLAVYFWNGKLKDILDLEPPPNLAPIVAEPIRSCKNVYIEVSKASLPSNTTHDGKTANVAYNFSISDGRPGLIGGLTYSTEPVLSSEPGEIFSKPLARQSPGERGIALWRAGPAEGVDNHLLLRLEPMDEKTLPPQLGRERYLYRSDNPEE